MKNLLQPIKTPWVCPANFQLVVSSSYHTNTFGVKNSHPERILAIRKQLDLVTKKTLQDLGCPSIKRIRTKDADALIIRVIDQHSISALAQGLLTGLSFGLIPSQPLKTTQPLDL